MSINTDTWPTAEELDEMKHNEMQPQTEEDQEQTYRIKATRLQSLEERFEKIAKRARRIGCVPPTFETLRVEDEAETEYNEETKQFEPTGKINRYHVVRLIGERPVIAGHKFVGTLEHNSEVGLILRTVPGEAIPPSYREADSTNCDHCKKRIRTRTETFIVEHIESKTFKQVGRQCVADFLGGVDPKNVLAMMEALSQAGELLGLYEGDSDEGSFGDRRRELFDVLHVLALTSALCRNIGWIPRSKAAEWDRPSTATLALAYMAERDKKKLFADRYGRVNYEEMAKYDRTEKDYAIAELALEWARGLSESGRELNDYLYNLTTIAKAEAIEARHFGLTCSIVSSYNREQERLLNIERERKQFAASQHFGQIKKREVFILTLTRYTTTEGQYGVTHVYGFQDRVGNFAVWFASTDSDLQLGRTYRIKATVKDHGEYKGIKQTVLTRGDMQGDVTDLPEDQWELTAKELVKNENSGNQLSNEQKQKRSEAARKAIETRKRNAAAKLAA